MLFVAKVPRSDPSQREAADRTVRRAFTFGPPRREVVASNTHRADCRVDSTGYRKTLSPFAVSSRKF